MVSQLWADVKYHVPTGFGFRRRRSTRWKHAKGESTEKVGKGGDIGVFLLITYGHSQLSILGGERFFVVGGVRAFGGEALAQVVDFVVVLLMVLLKKKGGLFV